MQLKAWRAIFQRKFVVFHFVAGTTDDPKGDKLWLHPCVIRCTTKEEIPAEAWKQLIAWEGNAVLQEYSKEFRRGGECWIAYVDGCFAGVLWSILGERCRRYVVPLGAGDAYLYLALTMPSWRGRRVYPAMLTAVRRQLQREGTKRFYIDCRQWNRSSARGIQKAGFQVVGLVDWYRWGTWSLLRWHDLLTRKAAVTLGQLGLQDGVKNEL